MNNSTNTSKVNYIFNILNIKFEKNEKVTDEDEKRTNDFINHMSETELINYIQQTMEHYLNGLMFIDIPK